MARPERPRQGDIDFSTTVTAKRLTFREEPETEVRFTGDESQESASGSDRVNLPERVEAGVTYRDVRVDYRLATRLTGADQPAGSDEGSPSGDGRGDAPPRS